MNKRNIIYILLTVVFFSSASYGKHDRHDRHNNHQSHHTYNQSNQKYKNRSYRRNNNNDITGFNTHGYNKPYRNNYNNRNRYRNKNYRQYKRQQNYNNRRYINNYSNYQPYYQSRYTYRPLRGLGHYYTDSNYGYGHWHDNNWCPDQHSQIYYSNYYSNYPYQNGWVIGDGDFGINFYFD